MEPSADQNKSNVDSSQPASPTTQRVFEKMIDNIQTGHWPVGSEIPSERKLVEQMGVSRISLREAMSMLRVLGVLDTSHGRKTRVRQVDSKLLGELFPLMLSLEGQQSFEQVFEIRLALESQTAALAAERRTDEDVEKLEALVQQFRSQIENDLEKSIETDLKFHHQIAKATGNPLFPMLLDALSNAVRFVQNESCKDDLTRRMRALRYHEVIAKAILEQDPQRASTEMEAHLRSSADRILSSGMLAAKSSDAE